MVGAAGVLVASNNGAAVVDALSNQSEGRRTGRIKRRISIVRGSHKTVLHTRSESGTHYYAAGIDSDCQRAFLIRGAGAGSVERRLRAIRGS